MAIKSKKQTTIIHDRLYSKLAAAMSKNLQKFSLFSRKFIDQNSEALFASHPGIRIKYNKTIEESIFEMCGILPEEVTAAVDATGMIGVSERTGKAWYTRSRPVFLLLCVLLSYFEKTRKVMEKKQALMLLSIIIYSVRQNVHFQHNSGAAFEAAMRYTVNQLGNKFYLKQNKNVFGMLEATAEQSDKMYTRMLTSGTDEDILKYITNLYTRIGQVLKNVANKFYENLNSGKYLNLDKEAGEGEDDEGDVLDVENLSTIITQAVNNVYLTAKTDKPNQRLCRVLAAANGVSQSSLYNCVERVFKDEDQPLKELFRLILTIFLVDNKESPDNINSTKFNLVSLQTYAKSHTNEKNVIALKVLLDEFLKKYSTDYNKTQRVATKISFRKALFLYMVTHIQQNYKSR
jgi:hypothetical protein